MGKIELKFIYGDESFELVFENKTIKCFTNIDSNFALITDKDNNVLFTLKANCSQNFGFLSVEEVKN